jgi:hypothetical protein
VDHLLKGRVGSLLRLDGDDLYPSEIGHHIERGAVDGDAMWLLLGLAVGAGCSQRVRGNTGELGTHLGAPCGE